MADRFSFMPNPLETGGLRAPSTQPSLQVERRQVAPNRAPSLEEWIASHKRALPVNTPDGYKDYPKEYVHKYLSDAAQKWADIYGKQMELTSPQREPNSYQAAESMIRQGNLQEQGRGYEYDTLRKAARARMATNDLDFQPTKQREWQEGQDNIQAGQVFRNQRAQDQVQFGRDKHVWDGQKHDVDMDFADSRLEGQEDANDLRMGRKFRTLSPQEQRIKDAQEREATAEAGYAEKRDKQGPQPHRTPTQGGGGRTPPAEKPYEQLQQEYVDAGLKRYDASGAAEMAAEANVNEATGWGPDWEAAPKAAAFRARQAEAQRLAAEFRQREGSPEAQLQKRLQANAALREQIRQQLAGGGS